MLIMGLAPFPQSVVGAVTKGKVAPAKTTSSPTPLQKDVWQQKWAKILTDGKAEGVVSMYGNWAPNTTRPVAVAFKEKFGINLEYSPFQRGVELLAKLNAERRAGLYNADVFVGGTGTLLTTMKPEKVLGTIEPLLVLPEVINAKFWNGNKIPFMDKDRMALGMTYYLNRFLTYNNSLIKEGELTSYKDVLKPKYRGKITLNDPGIAGAGNAFISFLAKDLWTQDAAIDFLKRLVHEQEAVIQRDNNLHVETVARGKYAIGLAPWPEPLDKFLKVKSPINVVIASEGTFGSSGPGAIGISSKPAHPNATAVFVNWLLSREGQTILSKAIGNPSMRTDVTTEGLQSIFLQQQGEKVYWEDEDFINFKGAMMNVSKKIVQ